VTDDPPKANRELIARLRAGRVVQLRAVGGSMWPTIRDGAILMIAPCAVAKIRVGQLVAYASDDGRLIVHRVVALGAGTILLRGDGLAKPDPPVADADVLGIATIEWQRPLTFRLPRREEARYLLRAVWRRLTKG